MTEASGKEVQLVVPAMAEYLDTVRLALYGVAVRAGFSYESIEDLKVAVTEACTFAILKQGGPDAAGEGPLRLNFSMTEDALRVSVQAGGEGVAFAEAVEQSGPLEGKKLNDVTADSLGLYLMQALVDEVQVEKDPAVGSETVVLLKKRE
ncbi:ATP-binding protein [Paenibacillus sp. P26]|nr:ATP-binding protein [Paenibacillus sp. P26]UUZ92293.1 ATP-binding protein [Paenibacillus sp. P25]